MAVKQRNTLHREIMREAAACSRLRPKPKHRSIRIENEGSPLHHAPGLLGVDYTLCGLSTDGDDSVGLGQPTDSHHKIDCLDCITLIEHCRTIPKRDYKP